LLFDAEGAGQTKNVTVVDNANPSNTDTFTSPVVNIDWSKPTISGVATTSANSNGWYKAPVRIQFISADQEGLSGIDTATDTVTLSNDGAGQEANGTATDRAGNSASDTVSGINIDQTKPTITLDSQNYNVDTTVDKGDVVLGSPALNWTAADATSHLSTVGVGTITFNAVTLGTVPTQIVATDNAGNTITVTVIYHVVYNFTGFFQPIDMGNTVVNVAKAGSAIPVKFKLAGNQGLNIFLAAPSSAAGAFNSDVNYDEIESTVTLMAGGSLLSYDSASDQYTYVWKTEKTWSGSRVLIVKFNDGKIYTANFSFKK
jgi:hypothetical protein